MIRYFIGRQINAAEKSLGASMEYMRHILRVSVGEIFRMRKLALIASHRKALPPAPFHVARLVAVMDEDCGDCVRIELNLARQAGVPPAILKAVVDMRPSDLPEELGDAYLFAECVVQNSGDIEPLRSKVRRRYGETGLVEISIAIALARTFPVIKRSLGYATECNLKAITVDA